MKITPDHLKIGLKILLKKKDLGYAEVAGKLGVSLPTFKRWMGAEEIKLGRLLEICAILETTLGELEALSNIEAKRNARNYTIEQEKFFAENMHYFTYLSRLFAGDSPEKIARESGLTAKSTELYLLRLERMDLLHRDGRGRVRLAMTTPPDWRPRGPLITAHYKRVIDSSASVFARRAARLVGGQTGENERLWISYGSHKVRREVYAEWSQRFKELLREIEAESHVEASLSEGTDQVSVVLSLMHATIELDDPESRNLSDTFGKLINL